jgi:hypothetical protein
MLPVSLDCPFLLPRRYYLTFICPVSCLPYVASFSGLPFFIAPSVFSNIYVSLCSEFRVVMFITISASKQCSVRLYLQLFVGGLISYLRYLCLFTYSGV